MSTESNNNNNNMMNDNNNVINDGTPSVSGPNPSNYRIVLSNIPDSATKTWYKEIILYLGGIADEEYTPEVTHVITPTISISMKCLSACAGGKWLLKSSFLEESSKGKRDIDIEIS